MKTTTIINQWYSAKEEFIDWISKLPNNASKSNFIYEFPETIEFNLDTNTRNSKIDSFMDYVSDYLYDHNVSGRFINDLICFIRLNKASFFENKVEVDYLVERDNTIIKAGAKLIKSFKYFLSNEEYIETLQNKASELIQENKVSGRFCISVHPLDYLSASESTYNWRSCHALDGDYRAGNLAYMTDEATVMCYLKGDKDEILPRFPSSVPWNSKKWRMLLFFNKNRSIFWAGRQYPFEANALLEFVRNQVLVKFVTGNDTRMFRWFDTFLSDWSSWSTANTTLAVTNYIKIKTFLYPLKGIVSSKNDLFYNDILKSTRYTPSYSWRTDYRFSYDWSDCKTEIGENPICPCCGLNEVEYSDEMVCVTCDINYGTQINDEICECHDCGTRIFKEDAYSDDDGNYYCEDCWIEGERE